MNMKDMWDMSSLYSCYSWNRKLIQNFIDFIWATLTLSNLAWGTGLVQSNRYTQNIYFHFDAVLVVELLIYLSIFTEPVAFMYVDLLS